MVSGLDFLPGGYGVEHGRGLGGVIEVETRQPKTNGYHGFAQIVSLLVTADSDR